MITLDVDVVNESGVRQAIARFGGRILKYTEFGVGGGNPNFLIEFQNELAARALINILYGNISESDFKALVVRC